MTDDRKAFLSCTEVARRLGLSRQRFWQLRKDGVFPQPQQDEETGRPYYTEEQLELCLDLRKQNVGMNGQVVLFYSPRPTASASTPKPKKKAKPKESQHASIIRALAALGLPGATDAQIDEAIAELFPIGKEEVERGERVRAIFLHLQRKNSSE